MGRDERAKQAELQRQLTQMRESEAVALDRLGRRLQPGDVVHFSPTVEPLFTIGEIAHELDPRAPAGMVRVVLQTQFPFHSQHGMTIGDLLLIIRPTTAALQQQQAGNGHVQAQPQDTQDTTTIATEGDHHARDAEAATPDQRVDQPAGPRAVPRRPSGLVDSSGAPLRAADRPADEEAE